MKYKKYFGAATEYEKQAELAIKGKEFERARDLYLRAAENYTKAYKGCPNTSEQEFLEEKTVFCCNRVEALKPKPRKVRRQHSYKDEEDEERDHITPVKKTGVTFDYVAGLEYVKEKIRDALINPVKYRDLYSFYKITPPKGILLYGPPGCGKTFIAKAAAGECGAHFISVKGSTVLNKWVGETEQRIKEVFQKAQEYAPCIVFWDEIDAIGGRRADKTAHARSFLNELLTQLDGTETLKEGVLIMAATNRPWDVDDALLRPGRFDYRIPVPPPDLEGRIELLKLYTVGKGRPIDGIDIQNLADNLHGYSCADIRFICNEAAKIPLKEAIKNPSNNPRPLSMEDFYQVINRILPSLTTSFEEIKRSPKAKSFPGIMDIIEEYERKAS